MISCSMNPIRPNLKSKKMNHNCEEFQDLRIVIFTRYPVSGQAKTRLIPALGPDGAAEFQKIMTEFTVRQARNTKISAQIRFTGGTESQMQAWLGAEGDYLPQGGGNLGERMERAFADAFAGGAKKVIIVGCDCPDNRADNMLNALSLLNQSSCVIGPAADGGYYLIGLSTPKPELFRNIDWGSDRVFRQTISKVGDYRVLPILSDVDEPDDIPPKISVVIPALNEERAVGTAVSTALAGFHVEAIVVDGGSLDDTRRKATQEGAKLLSTARGRAQQMNCGAKAATGEILLFLHADSELPPAWDRHVREVMKHPETVLGYFRFAIDGDFPGKRLIKLGTNLRSRLLKSPYGDQGLFLRRNDFDALGGFPEIPILEDISLVRQAGKRGNIRCANAELLTSGRRWIQHGAVRTTVMNQAVLAAAWLGADLRNLRAAYRGEGRNPFLAHMRHLK